MLLPETEDQQPQDIITECQKTPESTRSSRDGKQEKLGAVLERLESGQPSGGDWEILQTTSGEKLGAVLERSESGQPSGVDWEILQTTSGGHSLSQRHAK